jgi:hypothetical protein
MDAHNTGEGDEVMSTKRLAEERYPIAVSLQPVNELLHGLTRAQPDRQDVSAMRADWWNHRQR